MDLSKGETLQAWLDTLGSFDPSLPKPDGAAHRFQATETHGPCGCVVASPPIGRDCGDAPQIGYGVSTLGMVRRISVLHSVGVSSDFVGEYTQADGVQVGAAVGAAHATFAPWACTTPHERHDILLRASTEILTRREELARLLAREENKTLLEAAYATARLLSAASLKPHPGAV
jgi:hypothetical protein